MRIYVTAKVTFRWKMPLEIHRGVPVRIRGQSDNPSEDTRQVNMCSHFPRFQIWFAAHLRQNQ